MFTKNFITIFFSTLLYVVIFYVLQLFLYNTEFFHFLPTNQNLARWDSPIYYSIAQHGTSTDNSSWYPLFGLLWRLCHVNYLGMAMVNIVMFAFSFSIICTLYPVSSNERFLWLTTPSLYFMWVPYSESLFCLTTVIAFYGIAKNIRWMIWVGLFFASLTRATGVIMIPSLLVMELLCNPPREFVRSLGRYFVNYALPILVGTALFVWYQFKCTGIWFAYFIGQTEHQGHQWRWPILPFSNFFGTNKLLWLCVLALFVSFLAFILIIKYGIQWLAKKRVQPDRLWVFTLGYMPIIFVIIVFCNPIWGSLTTNLIGIHRYIFSSPFVFVFLYHIISKDVRYTWKHFLGVVLLANVVWLTAGSYIHITNFLTLNFISLIIIAYMIHANKKGGWATMAISAVNLVFQVLIMQEYLNGQFTD